MRTAAVPSGMPEAARLAFYVGNRPEQNREKSVQVLGGGVISFNSCRSARNSVSQIVENDFGFLKHDCAQRITT